MEPETITITISPVEGKYQVLVNGTEVPPLHDSVSDAARAAALTFSAAEHVLNSGPEGERLDVVGMAIIMKAVLGVCFDHLKEQVQAAPLEQRLKAGARVKDLLAAKRIPSDDLTRLVLTTLVQAKLVLPPPADDGLADEIQDLFRSSSTP